MTRSQFRGNTPCPAWAAFVLALAGVCIAAGAQAAATGKIQGKIVGTDTGEPLGFADVLLIPADTTMRRVGGLTHADGTFLLEAPAGRYTLQIRALSYATKRIEGITLVAGELLPFSTGLTSEAIQQEEIVVEAKARSNTEAALLSARKKAASLGDAVSAEQVRKSPDKDAAEVLRRVTGLSVADGKYVFVRGLGERYSSTEVDGVRIASPEQNKRVVPLDLVPANLLDNIVVQKTYTSDRPGEFGGGDVQVRTRDFPGRRTWSYSISQGFAEGVTFQDRRTYFSSRADIFGYGSASRAMPAMVDGKFVPGVSNPTRPLLAEMANSFNNIWSPSNANTLPNASYSLSYGDELKLLNRPLGVVATWGLQRWFDTQDESQRFFQGDVSGTPRYDYSVTRWTESVQLGGLGGLSYRLSPRHSLHLRGIYTNNADDEVRIYQGPDYNATDELGGPLHHYNTRYLYIQRTVLSGALEGKHSFSQLLGANVDWKLGRSSARRQQPDRREMTYNRHFYYEGDTAHWTLSSRGLREYGDMNDDGWGATISGNVPYRLGALGNGKVLLGYDRQIKDRTHFYRRFYVYPNLNDLYEDPQPPPDTLFGETAFDGSGTTGYLEDATYNFPLIGLDNYRASQRVTAGYLNVDLPLGRRLRGNVGVRVESGFQNVQSHALFTPDIVLQEGKLDNTDWLPSGNLIWGPSETINLRLAASRTLSRPDLNELSPSPFEEYVAGMVVKGNPDLKRAMLDNYDIRFEVFPGLSEVLAAGFFYKRLHEPIEQVVKGGSSLILRPENSAKGRNLGVEFEARTSLRRLWSRLDRLSINTNAAIISSEVDLAPQTSVFGSQTHPLQGQADYLVNAALSYATPAGGDVSVMVNATGRRLRTIGLLPLPDIYQQPATSLDAAMNIPLLRVYRLKFAAKNLLDPQTQLLQGDKEVSAYRTGRSYSIAFSFGS